MFLAIERQTVVSAMLLHGRVMPAYGVLPSAILSTHPSVRDVGVC